MRITAKFDRVSDVPDAHLHTQTTCEIAYPVVALRMAENRGDETENMTQSHYAPRRSSQTAPNLRLPHHRVVVHLPHGPHHVLSRTTCVPRPASLRHAVLCEAPIARRRVWAWRRQCSLVQPLTHNELRERLRGGHGRLGEGGGRRVRVRG